jgi:hypothetical protein
MARGSQHTHAPSQARNNIEAILRLEKEDERERALHHRIEETYKSAYIAVFQAWAKGTIKGTAEQVLCYKINS